ncbi:6-phosphogluconolactonase [Agriterribacter sp.]|uniref:6-phosphogluconolactonase n=1 Tax=Agriterribacter sp. TaxID=2821509 RepID=UPI002B71A9DC|nr:6-phosphogluconolactonase [Agriterribacter sp.]HRO48035.1 6-phosphogluconolactonase [Agriterribacter sp.]HRQ18142.1 6-phosphogluconolactonase [Agriterribacter sp.]
MLHIQKDPSAVTAALAEWITQTIETVLQKQNRFTWVLTGGNSPKALYGLLAASPYKERIAWDKLHIFWGDERAVPFSDDRNNAKMTYTHLLNKVPVIPEQVHVMRTDIQPEQSAVEYEKVLQGYFGAEGNSFDLVLSGMGDDGHTLSLFPGTAVIHEKAAWVKAFYLAAQQMYRITLTAPVVNRASSVVFLTFGANKAKALYEVLEGRPDTDVYPSQIIQPASGELHWFVDEAAAALLNAKPLAGQ